MSVTIKRWRRVVTDGVPDWQALTETGGKHCTTAVRVWHALVVAADYPEGSILATVTSGGLTRWVVTQP